MSALPGTQLLIGLGSGAAPTQYLPQAIRLLRERFGEVRLSTFYRTRPMGDPRQAPYVNGVAVALTTLSLADTRAALRAIEAQCGRVRGPRARPAAPTVDLDLLAMGSQVLANEDLPAAELLERDFCLIPAAELLPDWVHPGVGRTLRQLAAERFPRPTHILGPVDVPVI
jgi:2-amino-4-hydroxy-6-hydroxymethyldihydropteridine diphosphokinase